MHNWHAGLSLFLLLGQKCYHYTDLHCILMSKSRFPWKHCLLQVLCLQSQVLRKGDRVGAWVSRKMVEGKEAQVARLEGSKGGFPSLNFAYGPLQQKMDQSLNSPLTPLHFPNSLAIRLGHVTCSNQLISGYCLFLPGQEAVYFLHSSLPYLGDLGDHMVQSATRQRMAPKSHQTSIWSRKKVLLYYATEIPGLIRYCIIAWPILTDTPDYQTSPQSAVFSGLSVSQLLGCCKYICYLEVLPQPEMQPSSKSFPSSTKVLSAFHWLWHRTELVIPPRRTETLADKHLPISGFSGHLCFHICLVLFLSHWEILNFLLNLSSLSMSQLWGISRATSWNPFSLGL